MEDLNNLKTQHGGVKVYINKLRERMFFIDTGIKELSTPFFFPAISTVKTNFGVLEYLSIIEKTSYPGFLISSYDIFHLSKKDRQNILKKVSEITNRKIVTLLDNGNYEAYWYHDADWDFDKFKSVLTNITVDFSFSFDVFWEDCKDKEEYIQESISSIAKTAGNQKLGTTIPLIHSVPKMFPEVIRDIVDGINPEIIAVPERELGVSIFERVKTVKSIRQSLDDTGRNIPLHLLGTGNPISILVYTYYGADLYDGLEWCQTLINPKTMILSHFSHGDFIECTCDACKAQNLPYHVRILVHNLLFYKSFIEKIKESIKEDTYEKLLKKYLNERVFNKMKDTVG